MTHVKMAKRKHIRIVKVPLAREDRQTDRPANFPRMPVLYLELIENKAKIKQDLINKQHVPTAYTNDQPQFKFIDESSPPPRNKKIDTDSDTEDFDKRLDKLLKDDGSDKSRDKSPGSGSLKSLESLDHKSQRSDDSSTDSTVSSRESSEIAIKETKDDAQSNASTDNLSERLKELLDDESSQSVASFDRSVEKKDKYSKHRDKHGRREERDDAPTLAELEARGAYQTRKELRDVNQVSMNEHEEEDAKRELLFKFDLLRKSYPTAVIPEDFSIHTDYDSMKKSYDSVLRRLSLDTSVEQYKTYLIGGFMACEFVFGNFLGFDMQGFTQQQIISMHSYERLLIELGEKSYVPTGSKWPVELRLLFMIIMNAAFFIISKMIMKKTGANLMGMINGMNATPAVSSKPRRKMRGPDIDLDDIPDVGDL